MIFAGASAGSPNSGYLWVAVGENGGLATSTSTTASSWTARTSSFGTTEIEQVRAGGDGYFVAVGASGKLATSQDGITWTQRTSNFGADTIFDVAFGNGIWCAVGASGKISTASDPTGTWTSQSALFGGTRAVGVSYGNGLWVALSLTGEISTATDPTGTWTARTSTLTAGGGRPVWNQSQGIWVAGIDGTSATGALATSTDGITWTARNIPNISNAQNFAVGHTDSVLALLYVITGLSYDLATSTDGITWTDRAKPTPDWTNCNIATDEFNTMATYGASSIMTSTDGITWTSRTAPTFVVNGICHNTEV